MHDVERHTLAAAACIIEMSVCYASHDVCSVTFKLLSCCAVIYSTTRCASQIDFSSAYANGACTLHAQCTRVGSMRWFLHVCMYGYYHRIVVIRQLQNLLRCTLKERAVYVL